MKAKRLFVLLLVFLLVCTPAFSACSSQNLPQSAPLSAASAEETGAADPAEVYDQKIVDLQGHDFYFLVQENTHEHLKRNEIDADSLNGDKVNDAVFTRNARLEELYHCTISQEIVADPYQTARESLSAGEYTYDVIYTRCSDLRKLSSNGLLVDFFPLKQIQLEKAWWDHGMIEGLQIREHLYYLSGDIITSDDRAAVIMYYNADMIEKNRLENPVELAKAGKWTIDKVYEIGEACAEDVDGDGVWKPGTDHFAYMAPDSANGLHISAFGMYLGTMIGPGNFSLPATVKEEIVNAWDALRPLLTTPHRDVSDSGSRFRAGKAAFYTMIMGALLNFGNVTINYGILPMPKLNEQQEKYYSPVGYKLYAAVGIPATTEQIAEASAAGFESGQEMVAYFLNAMSYESRRILTPAFFEDVLKKQMVQTEETAEMLEMALENKFYDPVQIFDFGSIGTIFTRCGSNGNDTIGSDANYDTLVHTYEERLSSARKALNAYLTALNTLDSEPNA